MSEGYLLLTVEVTIFLIAFISLEFTQEHCPLATYGKSEEFSGSDAVFHQLHGATFRAAMQSFLRLKRYDCRMTFVSGATIVHVTDTVHMIQETVVHF